MGAVSFASVEKLVIRPFGSDGPITFKGLQEASDWLTAQADAWRPFHQAQEHSRFKRNHQDLLDGAKRAVAAAIEGADVDRAAKTEAAMAALRKLEELPYLASDGAGGRHILSNHQTNPLTASFVFRFWVGEPSPGAFRHPDLDSTALLRAAALWRTVDYGTSAEAARQRKSISTALGKWEQNFKALGERATAFLDHADVETADALKKQAETSQALTELHEAWKRQFEELEAHHAKALTDLNAQRDSELVALLRERSETLHKLEETFREHMRLKAPADYWIGKAKTHKTASNRWLIALLALIGVGVCVVGFAYVRYLFEWLDHFSKHSVGPTAIALLSVPALLYATLVRVAHRSYREELRLANDAEQRTTLVQTYLALTHDNESGVAPNERLLALHALFRGSAQADSPDDTPPVNALEAIVQGLKQKQ